MPTIRQIKRYSGRRLWDVEHREYLTMDDVITIVRCGENVVITDADGANITSYILLRALAEALYAGNIKLSLGASYEDRLHKMIRE